MKIRFGFVSNSSSSSFVCAKGLNINKVVLLLKMIVTGHNVKHNTHYVYDELFQRPFLSTRKHEREMKEDWGYSEPMGCVIVRSLEDNSIPYELWEDIERKLGAYRNHLG